jgi:hypothetical protein
MFDKTIGGHIVAEDSEHMTVLKECAEELWFPATIVSESEFLHSVKLINLNVIGLFRQIDYVQDFISERIIKDTDIYILLNNPKWHLYIVDIMMEQSAL